MGEASRDLYLAGVVGLGICFSSFSTNGHGQGETSITTIRVQDESGNTVDDAEAILITETSQLPGHGLPGQWKAGHAGTIGFTTDDITSYSNRETTPTAFRVVVRAKGYAPCFIETEATEAGIAVSPEHNVTLQKGKQVSLEIIPPPGMKLPADLQPQIIPKPFVGSTWSGRGLDLPKANVNIATGEVGSDGKFEFNITDNTPPLYLLIDHPGFLRGWQAEDPLATTGTSTQVQLPKPISVDVTFANRYADKISADSVPKLKVSTSRKIPGAGSWLIQLANYDNDPGMRTWNLRDLPPGNFYFKASEGPVESGQSRGEDYNSDTSNSVTLTAHTVIPPVVALDENGTTIPKAEARVVSTRASSHGWKKAKDGLITIRRDDLSNRYSGDETENDFILVVRAPGFAVNATPLKAGDPALPTVPVTLMPGRIMTLTITSEDDRPVPTDLVPIILSYDQFPGSLNSLWRPEHAEALALAKHQSGNQWTFNLPNDIRSFRIAVRDDDFLKSYWSEEYTGTATTAIEMELPTPGGLEVNVSLTSPPLVGKDADSDDQYHYSLKRVAGDSTSKSSITVDSAVIYETTKTIASNLPPGEYELSVRPRRAYTATSGVPVKIEAGTTATASITVEPPDPNADPLGRIAPKFPNVKVTDVHGRSVRDAQIIARKKSSRFIPTLKWQIAGTDGIIHPRLDSNPESPDGEYDLLVRTPGYPTTVQTIILPTSATELAINVKPGKEVKLNLTSEAGAIPAELIPSIFPESWGQPVWLSTQKLRDNVYGTEKSLNPTAVKPLGHGQYTLSVDTESTEPFYILVNHPGFLKGFQAGPFAPAQWVTSGTVDIKLPKPATLQAHFDRDGEAIDSSVITMQFHRSQKVPGANTWSLSLEQEELQITSPSLRATDLAPGSYDIKAYTAGADDLYRQETYSTRADATLDAGELETVTLKYRPFKKEWLEGPNTALIKILNQKGEPAKGAPYKVTWYESGYPQQTVAKGNVPDDGVIKLENLAGVDKPSTAEDLKERGGAPSYSITVAESRLGDVSFFEYRDGKFHPPADGKTTKELEFRIPPVEGDVAPDIAMIDLVTSETVNLKDFKGQVVLIDFWATWCGSCLGPMAEYQDIMRKHAEDWKGKAVILAVSIDDQMDTVLKYLEKNSWQLTRNTWAAPQAGEKETVGWKSPAAVAYGINSIPTMVLIDQNGIIRSRDHMSDAEAEIEKLLK